MNKYAKNPLVSIIIPVYNGSDYMKEAIDSALNQTYKNIEVLVINDGSNDDGKTDNIARSYGNKIRYYSKENGGVSTALNFGIQKMKGEFFSWLSHDDLYETNKIEEQVKLTQKFNDEKLIVLCNTKQIDKDSKEIFDINKNANMKENVVYDSNEALKKLFEGSNFYGCSLLIPKKAFEDCGFFDETLKFNQDSLMWVRFFFNDYKIVYIKDYLVSNRVHNAQVTQTQRDVHYENSKRVFGIIKDELIEKTTSKYNFCYMYARLKARYLTLDIKKDIILNPMYRKKLSGFQMLKLRMYSVYGSIRPFIRRIYYKLFKHVKTK